MRTFSAAVFALVLIAAGCKKNDNPVDSSLSFSTSGSFSTGNVKNTPVFFSFDSKDTTTQAQSWDIELSNVLMTVDPSIPPIKYPIIALNKSRNVSAKVVDGTGYAMVDPSAVSGLTTDTNDTTLVIGVQCLNYDGNTHRLSPYTNRTFVLKSGSGKLVKFQLVSYYNSDGVSGFVTFDYAIK